jgi:hypothetical protein
MNDSISHKTDYHASSLRFPDKKRYKFRKHHYLQAMKEKQNPQTPRIDQQNKSFCGRQQRRNILTVQESFAMRESKRGEDAVVEGGWLVL